MGLCVLDILLPRPPASITAQVVVGLPVLVLCIDAKTLNM